MPATITLQFDDTTSPAFETLVKNLSKSGDASNELNNELSSLREELDNLKRASDESSRSQSELNQGVQQTTVVVQESGKAWERTLAAMNLAGRGIYELSKAYVEYRLATRSLALVQDAANVAVRGSIGYLTGLGSAVTGAYGTWKLFRGILDSTGETFVDVETGMKSVNREFIELANTARNNGKSIQEYMQETGRSFDEFGVRTETNFTRLQKSISDLGMEVTDPLRDAVQLTKDWWNETDILSEAWEALDKDVTLRADNAVENIGMVKSAYREFRIWMASQSEDAIAEDGRLHKGQSRTLSELTRDRMDAARKNFDLMDQQYAATEKLNELSKKNRDDFDRLRSSNSVFEQQIESRKELIRLQELGIEGLQKERRELEQRAGQLAQSDKFTEERQKAFESQREWLYSREQQLIEQNEKVKKDALLRTYADQQKLAEEDDRKIRQKNEQEYRDYLKSVGDKKRADEESSRERSRQIQDEFREKMQFRQRERDEERKLAEEQRRNHESRVKELASSYSSGMSLKDARGRGVDLERNALQQIGQLRQQATQQFVSGDIKGYMQSHQQAIQIYQQTLQQMKKLKSDFAKDGSVLDQIKSQFSDKDILNQVAENRFQQAGKGLMEKNRDGFDAFRKGKAGGELSGDEERLSRQFERQAEKLQNDIRRQVQRDARSGRIGEEEATKATNNLTDSTIRNMEQSGKFAKETTDGLKMANDNVNKATDVIAQNQELAKQAVEVANKTAEKLDQLMNDSSNAIAKARRGAR